MKRKLKQWWTGGHQFHQYQQNEQSPLILIYWAQKKPMTYDDENPRPDLGLPQTCGGVKQVNEITILSS